MPYGLLPSSPEVWKRPNLVQEWFSPHRQMEIQLRMQLHGMSGSPRQASLTAESEVFSCLRGNDPLVHVEKQEPAVSRPDWWPAFSASNARLRQWKRPGRENLELPEWVGGSSGLVLAEALSQSAAPGTCVLFLIAGQSRLDHWPGTIAKKRGARAAPRCVLELGQGIWVVGW